MFARTAMKSVVPLILLVFWASCLHSQSSPELSLFRDFVRRYNKPYVNDSAVFEQRFLAFKVSLSAVELRGETVRLWQESLRRQQWLNSYEAENGGSAVYGINKFSDLTPEEFKGNNVASYR